MNNICQLLDRARTLATQSASGTFTGDRNVLNSEFSTVIIEIDRQAQAIGLNTGGELAKSLSVFVGGGKTSNGVSATINGSVVVDLSQSTIDAKSLGLKGVQSIGVAGTDIGTGSPTSSVAKILADTTNAASEAVTGSTDFYLRGSRFWGCKKVKVSVNLSGVTDPDTLVSGDQQRHRQRRQWRHASGDSFQERQSHRLHQYRRQRQEAAGFQSRRHGLPG